MKCRHLRHLTGLKCIIHGVIYVSPISCFMFHQYQLFCRQISRFKLTCNYFSLGRSLRVILCKIRVILKGRGHGTSSIWLKFCMHSCFGVLTTKWMFQSSGKFYFGSSEHGRFLSVPKGSQYGGSHDFLSSSLPAYHNL